MSNENISSDIIHILEDWLEAASHASYLGVTIDDNRTDDDRDRQYLMELDKAHDNIIALFKTTQIKAYDELIDKVIDYIRSGNVAGSFSEGCDCVKCDRYEKKVRAALTSIINQAKEGLK